MDFLPSLPKARSNCQEGLLLNRLVQNLGYPITYYYFHWRFQVILEFGILRKDFAYYSTTKYSRKVLLAPPDGINAYSLFICVTFFCSVGLPKQLPKTFHRKTSASRRSTLVTVVDYSISEDSRRNSRASTDFSYLWVYSVASVEGASENTIYHSWFHPPAKQVLRSEFFRESGIRKVNDVKFLRPLRHYMLVVMSLLWTRFEGTPEKCSPVFDNAYADSGFARGPFQSLLWTPNLI